MQNPPPGLFRWLHSRVSHQHSQARAAVHLPPGYALQSMAISNIGLFLSAKDLPLNRLA